MLSTVGLRKKPLDIIKAPIEQDLRDFEKHFRNSMKSRVPLMDKITHYIIRTKGKQIRPIIVFLTAKMLGDVQLSTHRAASLIELLHTATLVHDDVVDDANQRRGFFSINALWKNKVAVLVGDYLLSRGLLLAVEHKEYKLLEIMSQAVKDLPEGELLQLEKARRLDIEEQTYFDIIQKKTASLIAATFAAGAASVSQDEQLIAKIRQMGEDIGIAYQIKDDLFDFGTDDVGKPLGIDIKEKKMTLPLIHALEHTSRSEKRRIISIVKRHSEKPNKVSEVIDFVRDSGGLQYATEKMNSYRAKAFDALYSLPESPARDAMAGLIDFVIDRKK